MDLRIIKTKKALSDAFLSLLAAKPVNKITITELTQKALVSKATFYLHYTDIYDLLEHVQNDLISDIIKSIPHPELMITDPSAVIGDMISAFSDKEDMLTLLFGRKSGSVLSERIEFFIKEAIYKNRPEYKGDMKYEIMLTFLINGAFYSYLNHSGKNPAAQKYIADISSFVVKSVYKEE